MASIARIGQTVRRLATFGHIPRICYQLRSHFSTQNILELSPHDVEKELFKMKRKMASLYSMGDFGGSMLQAIEMEETVEKIFGKSGVVYASCLNNVGLMNKMVGNLDTALEKYTSALHIYEEAVGKKHSSYGATLANVGVLYKSLAEKSTGMDKLQLLERAEEALNDSLQIRTALYGDSHKDTLSASNHLATVWGMQGKKSEAENILRKSLEICRTKHGDLDSLTATTLNNLGLMLKGKSRCEEARKCYEEAIDIRSKTIGDMHPETIVAMHNLAELLITQGKSAEASTVQEQILKMTQKVFGDIKESPVEPEAKERGQETDSNSPESNVALPHADSIKAVTSSASHDLPAINTDSHRSTEVTKTSGDDAAAVATATDNTMLKTAATPPKVLSKSPFKPANRKKPKS